MRRWSWLRFLFSFVEHLIEEPKVQGSTQICLLSAFRQKVQMKVLWLRQPKQKTPRKTHHRHDIHKSPSMIRPSPQAVAKLGWCFTGRSNEGLTVELTDKNCLTYELLEPGTEFGEL